ncbi:unnamed protein product [Blepharisma stoltei]|uniref:COPI associated protein n=1 Tax=Blepharisma stoltei TaxID=1481888 RepID=A0AAU9IAW3_9CILI|nr:unnamed protein product [Blepharisma stoltei]
MLLNFIIFEIKWYKITSSYSYKIKARLIKLFSYSFFCVKPYLKFYNKKSKKYLNFRFILACLRLCKNRTYNHNKMVGQSLDDKRFTLLMKIFSVLCGLGMIILGVMVYVYFDDIGSFIQFIMALYYILFGILAILGEFPIPHITKYFSFLKKYFGKGLYFIFMGTISFSYSEWYQLLISLANIILGIMYIVFSFSMKNRLIDEAEKHEENEPAREAAPPSQV